MLEVCYQASPEVSLLHSRKYKLRLSGQNNKSLNSVQLFSKQLLNKRQFVEVLPYSGSEMIRYPSLILSIQSLMARTTNEIECCSFVNKYKLNV